MRWVRQLGRARQLGEASCLASLGWVTLAGETTFPHVNSLARLRETRQQNLAAVISYTRPSTTFFHISKAVKFRWTSIKCFHDDTSVLLVAVEFVMETV